MKKVLLLTVILLLVTTPTAMWGDVMVCQSTRTGNDVAFWTQLGPPGMHIVSPFSAAAGLSGIRLIGTFNPPKGTQHVGIETKKKVPGGFWGDFFINDSLILSSISPGNSLRLQFFHGIGCSKTEVGVLQAGAQIQPLLGLGHMATITAYDSSLAILGQCFANPINNKKEDNSAPYLGIADMTAPNIYYVQFDMDDGFVINQLSVSAVASSSSCVQPPNTTMVAWYPFDEPAGTGTSGDLAMANVGTWYPQNNLPMPVCGVVSNGLSFDGTDQYVESPSTIATNFGPRRSSTTCSVGGRYNIGDYSACTGDFSIDTWIHVPMGATNDVMTILDRRSGAVPQIYGYHLAVETNQQGLVLQLADGVGANGFSNYESPVLTPPLQGTGWHHIAVTVQRSSQQGITWYYDGQCLSSGAVCTTSDPTDRTGSLVSAGPLRIGTRTAAEPFTGWFQGDLDELEIYNRVLTPAEVLGIYNAGSHGKCKPNP